jgi:hypothetical protein
MLRRQMPHALITTANPVFDYELRRVRWPRSVEDLQRYTINVLIALLLFIGGLWLVSRLLYNRPNAGTTLLMVSGLVALSSVVIMVASDLYYMLTTVGAINHQIAAGQWDLLRITELRGENILLAKYAIAQIRAWRLLSVEVAIRVAGMVLAVLFEPQVLIVLVLTLPVSWCLIILVAGYVAEPLWRMQAIIALGVAIAARIQNYTFAILSALGFILVIQVLRFVVLAVLWYVTLGLLTSRANVFCMLPLASIATTYILYVFYQTLQKISLRQATRFVIRPN